LLLSRVWKDLNDTGIQCLGDSSFKAQRRRGSKICQRR
jgi:hypothetical protein